MSYNKNIFFIIALSALITDLKTVEAEVRGASAGIRRPSSGLPMQPTAHSRPNTVRSSKSSKTGNQRSSTTSKAPSQASTLIRRSTKLPALPHHSGKERVENIEHPGRTIHSNWVEINSRGSTVHRKYDNPDGSITHESHAK